MEKYVSFRPSEVIIKTYFDISCLRAHADRNLVTAEALRYVDSLSEDAFTLELSREKDRRPGEQEHIDIPIPTSLKVKVDSALLAKVQERFKTHYGITRVHTTYLLKTSLAIYYRHLLDVKPNLHSADASENAEDQAAVYLRLAAEITDMLAAGLERDKSYINKLIILMDARRNEK